MLLYPAFHAGVQGGMDDDWSNVTQWATMAEGELEPDLPSASSTLTIVSHNSLIDA